MLNLPPNKLFLFLLFLTPNFILGQSFTSHLFSEKSYLINPALTGISQQNKISLSSGYQGTTQPNYKNFQAAASCYIPSLQGGLEGYVTVKNEGLYKETSIAIQFSKFKKVWKEWTVGIGLAPVAFNAGINYDDIILDTEQNIYNLDFSTTSLYNSLWSVGLSTGLSIFDKFHAFGFAVHNIFNNASFTNNISKISNLQYVFSYGGNITLNKYKSQRQKTFVRPHFIVVCQINRINFHYGAFLGSEKFQYGLFLTSVDTNVISGISPALLLSLKKLKIIVSLNIFPKLPSGYVFGNDFVIQTRW